MKCVYDDKKAEYILDGKSVCRECYKELVKKINGKTEAQNMVLKHMGGICV